MKQQYLIWNKDSVSEETIFADIKMLSGGKLTVPEDYLMLAAVVRRVMKEEQ